LFDTVHIIIDRRNEKFARGGVLTALPPFNPRIPPISRGLFTSLFSSRCYSGFFVAVITKFQEEAMLVPPPRLIEQKTRTWRLIVEDILEEQNPGKVNELLVELAASLAEKESETIDTAA
jgi:hypothetical protein